VAARNARNPRNEFKRVNQEIRKSEIGHYRSSFHEFLHS